MKPLKVLSKFENHFANQTVRFQVQLEAGGYFFAQEVFEFAIAASRASRYHLAIFEFDFTNLTSIVLVGLRPNPMFSKKKLRWPCILADAEWANFLRKKFVLGKFALIHSILHQTGTITSGFEGKKRKYHFLKIWTLLWYALSRAFSKKRKHSFRFLLGILLKSTENRKECFLKISSRLWYAFYKPSSNLENLMTVCMGYPAMTPQGRAEKRRWKGVGSPCRENGTQNLKSRWYEKPEPVVPILPWNSFHIP